MESELDGADYSSGVVSSVIKPLPANTSFVTPGYRGSCLEFALRCYAGGPATPDKIVAAAKMFYAYVYTDA